MTEKAPEGTPLAEAVTDATGAPGVAAIWDQETAADPAQLVAEARERIRQRKAGRGTGA